MNRTLVRVPNFTYTILITIGYGHHTQFVPLNGLNQVINPNLTGGDIFRHYQRVASKTHILAPNDLQATDNDVLSISI